MAKRVFTVTIDGKEIGKRTSKSRIYTHAILGQGNEEKIRKWTYRPVTDRLDETEGHYFRFWPEKSRVRFLDRNRRSKCPTTDHLNYEYHKNHVHGSRIERGDNPGTLEEYLTKCRANEIEFFEASVKRGVFNIKVLQWSMSRENAEKASRSHQSLGYLNVRVVEVDQVKQGV